MLINTGGGLTGGDRMSLDAVVVTDASAVLTTQAAEKVYRSEGLAMLSVRPCTCRRGKKTSS